MSLIDKIKDKFIRKREFNDVHHDLKYAVEQKPKVNLDKYNPFPTPEQLAEQRKAREKRMNVDFEKIPDVPKFEPMDMPLSPDVKKPEVEKGEDEIKFIIEQLESLRSQNEMILHRLKNIERRLNGQ